MRRFAVILLALPLCGCFADQKKQTAACEFEAVRTYPNDDRFSSARTARLIVVCMGAHGYEPQSNCETPPIIAASPYCYVPMGWLDRMIYRIESHFD